MKCKNMGTNLKAVNIQWDEGDQENSEVDLPKEILLPYGMTDIEEISDYITATTGYLHYGFGLEAYAVSAETQEAAKPYYVRLHYAWEINANNDVFHAFETTDPNVDCNPKEMKEKMRVDLEPSEASEWGCASMLVDLPESLTARIQAEAVKKYLEEVSAFDLCQLLRKKKGVVAVQMWTEDDIRNAFETELDISDPDQALVDEVASKAYNELEDCSGNWEKVYAALHEVMGDYENDQN